MKPTAIQAIGLCISLLIVSFFLSCAPIKHPPREAWLPNYNLNNELPNIQSKENVTIELSSINWDDMGEYPELFEFDMDIAKQKFNGRSLEFHFPPGEHGRYYAFTFGRLPTFKVSITNGTGHILRMKDARVYIVLEGQEPIPAITKVGAPKFETTKLFLDGKEKEFLIPVGAASKDGSLLDFITRFELSYYESYLQYARSKESSKIRSRLLYRKYPIGILADVYRRNYVNYKLINSIDRELLPDFSLSGFLCFPVQLKQGQRAKIMFYDVTTETDAAGNPTKKTQFEFEFIYQPTYMKFNELTREWVKTTPPNVIYK